MIQERGGVSYCSLCAWRKDCKIKYRFQNSLSLYCREYTRDVTVKIKEPDEKAEAESKRKG